MDYEKTLNKILTDLTSASDKLNERRNMLAKELEAIDDALRKIGPTVDTINDAMIIGCFENMK